MPNTYFQFKKFRIEQAQSGMKVTTDACLFGGWVASEMQKHVEPIRILDIGAGTGLLSLMIAQVANEAQIDAVEINKTAHTEATVNFKNSPWSDQLNCVHTPLQNYKSEPYDLIICNPPFFKGNQPGADNNKNEALHASSLSMEDLLNHILRLLDKKGRYYLLYPEREMTLFIALAKKVGLYAHQRVIVKNQQGHAVFREMVAFTFKEMKEVSYELIIRKRDRKYTQESWELLKSYYLEYNSPVDK